MDIDISMHGLIDHKALLENADDELTILDGDIHSSEYENVWRV